MTRLFKLVPLRLLSLGSAKANTHGVPQGIALEDSVSYFPA